MKFPKQIYVKWEEGNGSEDKWLVAQTTERGIVEADETVTIAIYKLVRTATASAKTKISIL